MQELTRNADATRPISLSNCDNKIIASALADPLSVQAQYSVSQIQKGFVKKRCMNDHILNIEARIIDHFSFQGYSRAGLFSVDNSKKLLETI